jgi:hypothetical protein
MATNVTEVVENAGAWTLPIMILATGGIVIFSDG